MKTTIVVGGNAVSYDISFQRDDGSGTIPPNHPATVSRHNNQIKVARVREDGSHKKCLLSRQTMTGIDGTMKQHNNQNRKGKMATTRKETKRTGRARERVGQQRISFFSQKLLCCGITNCSCPQ